MINTNPNPDQAAERGRLDKLLGYLKQDPDNFSLLSEASDLALQLQDNSRAKELVERALALRPQDGVTRYRMAVVLLNEGKAHEALIHTQALIDSGETHAAVRYEHARGLAVDGRFDEAEPYLAVLLPDAAAFRDFPYLYIRVLHHLGKVDEAIAFADKFAVKHPDDHTAQGMRSLLYLDSGDIKRAGELARGALQGAPQNMDALLTVGTVALADEDEDEAKRYFDTALSLNSANGRAWAGLALVNMAKLDLKSAEADFEKAVQYMPKHLGSYNALAWARLLQHNYAGAKKALQDSLEVDRNFGETYGALAVLAALENQWEEAKRLADTAVRLQPDSFAGRYAQSLIVEHRGRPEQARAMVEAIMKNAPAPGGGNLAQALARFVSKQSRR